MSLRAGKLSPDVLASLLARVPHNDSRVLLGPGIGRDAAVIDIGGDRVLVAKTDPITFATDEIGWYAVNVNANDIACMGARPAWFLATALLPERAPDDLPRKIFDQIVEASTALGIELVGGHTEVTIGIDRPIVVGVMLGEAARDEIVSGEGIVPGDLIVMCGSAGIEGTALLAREAAAALRERKISDDVIARAASFLHEPGISVVRAAADLCATVRPRYMHDPTEGGVATALYEMAAVAGRTLRIDPNAIPIRDETRAVCGALGLYPLGLIASGALLAIVPASAAGRLAPAYNPSMAGTTTLIGEVVAGAAGVILTDATPLPSFDRDEIARYFDSQDGDH
jgi:hydrogenase maturation factor